MRTVKDTHSVDSMVGVVGMIMSIQLTNIVVMMKREKSEWTSMYMATRRIGLNGSSIHIASVAENLYISFPLLMTTKVYEQTNTHREIYSVGYYE